MYRNRVAATLVAAGLLTFAGCTKKSENPQTASSETPAPAAQPAPQATPSTSPAPAAKTPETKTTARNTEPSTPAPTTPAETKPAPAPPPPPPPKPATFVIPAGTAIAVRTTTAMSTKTSQTGDSFAGSLAEPIVIDGVVVARRGSAVSGAVVNSDPGGRVKGKASLTVDVKSIRTTDGQAIPVSTSAFAQEATSAKKKDALKIGGGAALGALVGGLAGGGKGAAIGAAAGGGAGTGLVLGTRGNAAVIPAESVLHLTLAAPVRVTEREPGSLAKRRRAAAADDDAPANPQ